MTRHRLGAAWLVLILTASVSGCGWWGGEEEAKFDGEFSEAAVTDLPAKPLPKPSVDRLRLNLKEGDRFPLLKTVEQTLTQASQHGQATNRSTLELLLAIAVEKVEKDRKLLSVRYHRVRYWHDVAGQTVRYDSESPERPVPLEVQAYHGLVNNGFSFWIGADNRVIELVGFESFLNRCVRQVPIANRQAVWTKLAESSADFRLANFVDDSIGLLPYNVGDNQKGSAVKVGDTWQRSRQVVQPIPMFESTNCTLKALNDQVAEIDILGTITPSTTYGPSDRAPGGARLTVRGGHSFGNCTIDRKTGLPTKSRVERYLDMVVMLSDASEFEQRKHIVTTIRAFPQQQAALPAGAHPAHRSSEPALPKQLSPRDRVTETSSGSGRR